jgi:hypothetical protein
MVARHFHFTKGWFLFVALWVFLTSIDENKRGCISCRSEAFAFGSVKSPCYEFTYSDFTIPTATVRRYIPAKTTIDKNSKRLPISTLMGQPLFSFSGLKKSR